MRSPIVLALIALTLSATFAAEDAPKVQRQKPKMVAATDEDMWHYYFYGSRMFCNMLNTTLFGITEDQILDSITNAFVKAIRNGHDGQIAAVTGPPMDNIHIYHGLSTHIIKGADRLCHDLIPVKLMMRFKRQWNKAEL